MTTGFYGVPGERTATKVHLVHEGKPLCGWRPRKEQEYQWCANGAYNDMWRYTWRYTMTERDVAASPNPIPRGGEIETHDTQR